MKYIKKFIYDIWNLRLVTNLLHLHPNFRDFFNIDTPLVHHYYTWGQMPLPCFYKRKFSLKKKKEVPTIDPTLITTHKYFFYFFFDLFKSRRRFRWRKRRPFVYRIDEVYKYPRVKRFKKRFVTLRIVKFYYSLLKFKHFRKISRLSKRQSGLYEHNYILNLEGRLINFLYRTGFVDTIFKSLYYIKGGFVSINWKVKTYPNEVLSLFDILSFIPLLHSEIMVQFLFRLHSRIVLHPPLRFIFVSFFFIFAYLFLKPLKKDIPNRKMIDIYRLVGYPILYKK